MREAGALSGGDSIFPILLFQRSSHKAKDTANFLAVSLTLSPAIISEVVVFRPPAIRGNFKKFYFVLR
jgi:hypothetical protein